MVEPRTEPGLLARIRASIFAKRFSNADFWGRVAATFVCITGIAGLPASGRAQGIDCAHLQAQIAALDQSNARSNPYAGAAHKQRNEIERTRGYAQSIGCDRQQFLFFGSAPPPQCGQLNARIHQMEANLAQLEANAGRSGNNPQRQDLVARYNAYCRQQQQPKGFFESLFGGAQPEQPPADVPVEPTAPADEEQQKPHGGSEAVCVRSCDGGFFPLTYSARHANGDNLTELCKALCPNAEVSVYTLNFGQEIQTAVSLDGTPYKDLPAALKFQKSTDPACTCRPPGQSWAEALGGAERLLGHERKGDIIVTPEKSAEMSRPKLDPSQRTKVSQSIQTKIGDAKLSGDRTTDDIESRDAASAAQAPTASKDSAGIAAGEVANGASYPEGHGPTVESTGPDGVKRHVRIVGPPL